MLIPQTDKKLFDSHSLMFIFSRKQLGISQFWKNILNGVTNQKTDPWTGIIFANSKLSGYIPLNKASFMLSVNIWQVKPII